MKLLYILDNISKSEKEVKINMFRVLKKYRLGNTFKYVSLPISTSVRDIDIKNNYVNDKKLDNNLIRAKNKIRDNILCNDFKYFVTITCNNERVNRYDLTQLRRYITNIIRYYRKKYNVSANYILIPEKHKKGGYHLHGVFDGSFERSIYINKNGYDSISIFDNIGFTSIEEIVSIDKISSYITKYVSKDFACRGKGEHCYFISRGLNKPQLDNELVYNDISFDNAFFTVKNDFCYVQYSNCGYYDIFLRKRYNNV